MSREKVHEREQEEYVRLRKWLVETDLESDVSERILGYSWHSRSLLVGLAFGRVVLIRTVVFGEPAQYCLDVRKCYCSTYGYCNLTRV